MDLTRSPIPLYYQIANKLQSEIESGVFPPNTMLPTEKELAERFGVSLVTVRAATRSLQDQGLIDRRRGKGTLVLDKRARGVWELGWMNDLMASVLPSRLEILSMGLVPAPTWVAERYGIERGARVHHMDTIRYSQGEVDEPFVTATIYHPPELASLLHRRDFSDDATRVQLVIGIVEEKCKLDVTNVRQTMSAKLADTVASKRLRVTRGHPLLEVTRDYFDKSGRLVQTGRSLYRSDRFEYVLNLSRAGRARQDSVNQLERFRQSSR